MPPTDGGDDVRITGRGSHDRVEARGLAVDGTGKVRKDVDVATVSVNGTLEVRGAVDAEQVDADGTLTFSGDTTVGSLEVDGSGWFGADLDAEHLKAAGSLSVEGEVDAREFESDGTTTVAGTVVASEAEFVGTVTVEGDTDVTELAVDGAGSFGTVAADAVEVDGVLKADDVRTERFQLDVTNHCSVDHLAAEVVQVDREVGIGDMLREVTHRPRAVLDVETVAADTVDVEATRAGTVAGESVTVGGYTEIDVVYTDDLQNHPNATVGEVRPYAEYRPDERDRQ